MMLSLDQIIALFLAGTGFGSLATAFLAYYQGWKDGNDAR